MKFIHLAFFACAVLLAACSPAPAPQETLKTLRYDEAIVTFAPDAREAVSREVDEALFGARLSEGIKKALSGFAGERSARVELKVDFYTLPSGASSLVPFATTVPTVIGELSLSDAQTGAPIGEATTFGANYASSGGIFFGSGVISDVDEQMKQIVDEVAKEVRKRLSEKAPASS